MASPSRWRPLFHAAPNPRLSAASAMAYPVRPALTTCSHSGTVACCLGDAMMATWSGPNSGLRGALAMVTGSAAASTAACCSAAPNRRRASPSMTTKRKGRSRP